MLSGDKLVGQGPSGAMAAQPICNRQVSGFESPLGLQLREPPESPEPGWGGRVVNSSGL